jgi:hypothetical protein
VLRGAAGDARPLGRRHVGKRDGEIADRDIAAARERDEGEIAEPAADPGGGAGGQASQE